MPRALAAGNAVHGLTAQIGHGTDTRPEPDPLAQPSPVRFTAGIVYYLLLYDVTDQFAGRPLTATPI
jgi:hypothetical protein